MQYTGVGLILTNLILGKWIQNKIYLLYWC